MNTLACILILSVTLTALPQCGRQEKPVFNPNTDSKPAASSNSDDTVTVSIWGTGFVPGVQVTIDGVDCTPVNVISQTQLTCILPNSNIPLVNIVITTPADSSDKVAEH